VISGQTGWANGFDTLGIHIFGHYSFWLFLYQFNS
jgi:hypothetical protein